MGIWPGFIGPSYTDQTHAVDVERSVNLYVEKAGSPGAASEWFLRGVPWYVPFFLPAAIAGDVCRGLFAQDGRAFTVFGPTLWEVLADGSGVSRGTVANDGKGVTIDSNGQNGHQLFLVSAGFGYIFDLNSNTLTLIGDADFPSGTAVQGAYLDGYFVVSKPTGWQISALFDGTNWAALDVAQRSVASDNLVATYANHRELWLIGSKKTEVWYNTGNANFPFQPISNVLISEGTEAPNSVTRLGDGVAWLATSERDSRYVVWSGAGVSSVQRISTPPIEAALRGYDGVSNARAWSYAEDGHVFYVLDDTVDHWPTSWVYDVSTGAWHERARVDSVLGIYTGLGIGFHAVFAGKHLVGDTLHNRLYQQGFGLSEDPAVTLMGVHRVMRRSPHVRSPHRLIRFPRLTLDLQPGDVPVGSASSALDNRMSGAVRSNPALMLRYSNDGGQTWGPELWTTSGPQGQWAQRAYWTQLGSAYRRVFEVSQDAKAARVTWVSADLEVA